MDQQSHMNLTNISNTIRFHILKKSGFQNTSYNEPPTSYELLYTPL